MTTKYLTISDIGRVAITVTATSPDGFGITQFATVESINPIIAPTAPPIKPTLPSVDGSLPLPPRGDTQPLPPQREPFSPPATTTAPPRPTTTAAPRQTTSGGASQMTDTGTLL